MGVECVDRVGVVALGGYSGAFILLLCNGLAGQNIFVTFVANLRQFE